MAETAKYGISKNDTSILRLALLGRMSATTLTNENVLPIGAKTRGLLAILAMSDRKPVLRSKLAHLLWSRRPELQARASLRQEIHRLADALSPLGVDVIAIERHTLALKPALTSVDAERISHVTPNSVVNLDIPFPPLLDELRGIDQAMDLWLAEQRARLDAQVTAALDEALQLQTDPTILLSLSKRMLLMNPFHERAWQTQIQSYLALGERRQAIQAAAFCSQQFRDSHDTQFSAEIARFLANVQGAGADAQGDGGANPEGAAVLAGAELADIAPVLDQQFGSLRAMERDDVNVHGTILVRAVGYDEGKPDLAALASTLGDDVGVYLNSQRYFNVISGPLPGESDAFRFDDAALRQKFQVTFVLSSTIHDISRRQGFEPDNAQRKLVIRITDLRNNGALIWATRIMLVPEMTEAYVHAALSEVFWNTFLFDGRRLAHRPAGELSAHHVVLRAVIMVLRGEAALFDRIAELLDLAEAKTPDEATVPFGRMILHMMRARELLHEDFLEEMGLAIKAARRLLALAPHITLASQFLARMELHFPERRSVAEAVQKKKSQYCQSLERFYSAIFDFVRGHRQLGADELLFFKELHPTHPLSILLEPDYVIVLAMGGRLAEALEAARALCGINPQLAYCLMVYMLAAAFSGQRDEALRVRNQLLSLKPALHAQHVLDRLGFLDVADVAVIASMLDQLEIPPGLPVAGAVGQSGVSLELGAIAATGYEGISGLGETLA